MNQNQSSSSHLQQKSNDFADHWIFYEKVIAERGYVNYHTQRISDELFKTGRPKHIFTFRDNNGNIYNHYAMELYSKRTGMLYYVVNRRPFN